MASVHVPTSTREAQRVVFVSLAVLLRLLRLLSSCRCHFPSILFFRSRARQYATACRAAVSLKALALTAVGRRAAAAASRVGGGSGLQA